jgi:hypothetical protein
VRQRVGEVVAILRRRPQVWPQLRATIRLASPGIPHHSQHLWDPTFNDDNNSNPWIFQELGHNPIRIVPRLQAKINSEFPGMRGISMTEYEGGG